jgi:hypothetical protein
MTPIEIISLLKNQGFTLDGDEYRKDILVFRRNEAEKRFEVYYIGKDGTKDTPVLLYDTLYNDMTHKVIENFVTNLYNAIKTFDET